MNSREYPRQSAFTLVELLISIAIIAMLIVIVVAVQGEVRSRGRNVHCISNLKQIGALFQLYAGEHNGLLRFHRWDPSLTPKTRRWADYLISAGYIIDYDKLVACPVDFPTAKSPGFSYGGLAWITGAADPGSRLIDNIQHSRAIHFPSIEQPSKYWLITDTWSAADRNQIYLVDPNPANGWMTHLRHAGRANFLFADGHIEALDLHGMRNLPFHPLHNAFSADKLPIKL